MPKKPPTAYILYFKNRKEKFMQQYPTFGITEITKLIAKEWGDLTREKQIPFLRDAEKAKFEYIDKMKEYASKHPGIKIPGEGNRRKNRPQGPIYQDLPIKKESLLDETSEDNLEDDEEEEMDISPQHTQANPPKQISVKQTKVPPTQNGKRKLALSESNSKLSDADQDEDSFNEVVIKKKTKS